jgi:hypothetical protein
MFVFTLFCDTLGMYNVDYSCSFTSKATGASLIEGANSHIVSLIGDALHKILEWRTEKAKQVSVWCLREK